MAVLPVVEREELVFPQWSDKRIPFRERAYNFVSDFFLALLVVFLMFFFGMAVCAVLSNWMGSCVC